MDHRRSSTVLITLLSAELVKTQTPELPALAGEENRAQLRRNCEEEERLKKVHGSDSHLLPSMSTLCRIEVQLFWSADLFAQSPARDAALFGAHQALCRPDYSKQPSSRLGQVASKRTNPAGSVQLRFLFGFYLETPFYLKLGTLKVLHNEEVS